MQEVMRATRPLAESVYAALDRACQQGAASLNSR